MRSSYQETLISLFSGSGFYKRNFDLVLTTIKFHTFRFLEIVVVIQSKISVNKEENGIKVRRES